MSNFTSWLAHSHVPEAQTVTSLSNSLTTAYYIYIFKSNSATITAAMCECMNSWTRRYEKHWKLCPAFPRAKFEQSFTNLLGENLFPRSTLTLSPATLLHSMGTVRRRRDSCHKSCHFEFVLHVDNCHTSTQHGYCLQALWFLSQIMSLWVCTTRITVTLLVLHSMGTVCRSRDSCHKSCHFEFVHVCNCHTSTQHEYHSQAPWFLWQIMSLWVCTTCA